MKFYKTAKFKRTITKIAKAAQKAKIYWALCGANAIAFYGNPPATEDIDIFVTGERSNFEKFIFLLKNQGIDGRETCDDKDFAIYFYNDRKNNVKVDIAYSIADVLHTEAIFSALIKHGVRIPPPEYLLAMKLSAYLGRKKKKDIDGAVTLLKHQKRKMDMKLLFRLLELEGTLNFFNTFMTRIKL